MVHKIGLYIGYKLYLNFREHALLRESSDEKKKQASYSKEAVNRRRFGGFVDEPSPILSPPAQPLNQVDGSTFACALLLSLTISPSKEFFSFRRESKRESIRKWRVLPRCFTTAYEKASGLRRDWAVLEALHLRKPVRASEARNQPI